MRRVLRTRSVAALFLLMMLGSCVETPPSRFYTLSTLDSAAAEPTVPARDLTVGLGPVTLPQYLNRSDIVRRTSAHEVDIGQFDKWVEPLEDMVPRVMAANLSRLLGTEEVIILPRRRRPELDYAVEIDVLRFDADGAGNVTLMALWQMFGDSAGDTPLVTRRTSIVEPATGAGYAAIAETMSRALERLSRDIAEAIAGAPDRPTSWRRGRTGHRRAFANAQPLV